MLAADVAASGGFAVYGPIIIATAGLITATVAALSRRDKKDVDVATTTDRRTQTALAGLTAAYDRCDAERARQEARADALQTRVDVLETELEKRDRHR